MFFSFNLKKLFGLLLIIALSFYLISIQNALAINKSPVSTVDSFLNAILLRDVGKAKSFLEKPDNLILVSNPHPVNYEILNMKKLNNDIYQIEAYVFFSYMANPYYSIEKHTFTVVNSLLKYKIRKIEKKILATVLATDNGESFSLERDNKRIALLTKSMLASKDMPKSSFYFGSLAYDINKNRLVFTIIHGNTIILYYYDLNSKRLKIVDKIKGKNIGIETLIIDRTAQYAALNLFEMQNSSIKPFVNLYKLDNGYKAKLNDLFKNKTIKSINTYYWNKNYLYIRVGINSKMKIYKFDVISKKLYLFE